MPQRLRWFMSSHNTPVLRVQGRGPAHNHQPSASVSSSLCCQRKDLIYLFIFSPSRPFRAQVSLQIFACASLTLEQCCRGCWWTWGGVELWGQLCALPSSLLSCYQRKLRSPSWVGIVRFSSQMSHQQWRVQVHFAFRTLCLLGVHLINPNSLSVHKSRPFHSSKLKFLVDASVNEDMKSLLKSLGFVIQNDFVFYIFNRHWEIKLNSSHFNCGLD